MIVGYSIWIAICTLVGGWFGHACYEELFLGLIFGWVFGVITGLFVHAGGGEVAASLAGSAIETFADVLDD